MIYFFAILLWISPASVDIQPHKEFGLGLDLLLALVVLEKLHLAQTLFGFCARLVGATEVFAFLLRNDFVAVFDFFDHRLPSSANFARPHSSVNTTPAVELLASGGFLRYVLNRTEAKLTRHTKSSDGRIALITGGTDGLGRAAAVLLAEHGYRVFAGGRNAERLAALQQLAGERKLPLTAIELDVCDDASVDRAVTEIEKTAATVDVLVNNAGIAIAAVMEEITLEDLRRQFETNYFGLVRMSQRVLPAMRRKLRGRIINMSSIAGKLVSPLFGPYSSSKHAVEAVSDAMRLEVYPFGIQVVLIEPGYIPTSMNRNAGELSSAYAKGAETSPYKAVYQGFLNAWSKTTKSSHYTPEDCARVIVRAVEDDRPRARYPVTREAKIGILARRWLSDRAMDRHMRKTMGIPDFQPAPPTDARK